MTELTLNERAEISRVARRLPFVLTCPVGSANLTTVDQVIRFLGAYADHADKELALLQGELSDFRRAATVLRGIRYAIANVEETLAHLDAAVLDDATIRGDAP